MAIKWRRNQAKPQENGFAKDNVSPQWQHGGKGGAQKPWCDGT